jgi:very-short-patch-repair endonuclease
LDSQLHRPFEITRANLAPSEVVTIRGFRATNIPRTLADLHRRHSLVEAVIAADAALHRRLVTVADLPRRVGELADGRSESPMETRLRLILMFARLPRPQLQVPLADADGAFARADLYYPQRRLVIEFDGSSHKDSITEDARRQNRLLEAGYRLLRFTAADVLGAPEHLVQRVRAALA